MGFSEGVIVMDSPNGTYYSGQYVNGRVNFELTKVKKVRGIFLKVKGFCKVHWTTDHTRRRNDRTEHYTVTHESYEEYLTLRTYLIGSKNEELSLNPGKYVYPFSFQMPETSPSSYESSNAHIRYQLKVVADRPFSIDEELHHPLRVMTPVDLNKLNCSEPVDFEFEQTYCCWCMNAGSSETLVKMPVTGYCPGQVIPLEVSCKNPSNVEIDFIKFLITKEITYRAESAPDTRRDIEDILSVTKGPVPGHTDRNWMVELEVPDMDIYNFECCSFIDIKYTFKVLVEPEGCHSSSTDSCPIKFGTIPLAGIQDNVNNPIHDQLPTTFLPSTYPTVASPYPPPIVNQPLSQKPYPGVASPYPPSQPFPAQISPYPSPNPPYPSVAPYPPNSPYPPNPYPPTPAQGNPPYPSGMSPFPSPAGVGPFPVTSPYPTGPGPVQMPSLPRGAAVPYPPNVSSPYAAASAPAPATPGSEQKNLEENENKSPYNPDFINGDKKNFIN